VFTRYHAFPVVRHTADRAALRRALEILAAGEGLILYPEGTRVDDAQLKQPEPGVGFLAQRSGTLVLPVALTGTNDCFPKGAWFPRRVRVTVRFGKPFRLEEQRPDGSRVTREEAAAAIMLAIAEMLPPENRGVFADLEERRARLSALYV
jgi:1-acyl-sn-glycerol-3-phosphate acyltransferase